MKANNRICVMEGCGRGHAAKGYCALHYYRLKKYGRLHRRTPIERFETFVRVLPNGCWEWTGHVLSGGYGQFSVDGKTVKPHKWRWEVDNGPVPDGMQLDHACHTRDQDCRRGLNCPHRRCVNPAHLEAVPLRMNVLRGRGWAGDNARKTHCKHGHEFTAENTLKRSGNRACRTCQNMAQAKQNAKLRGGRPPLPRGHNNSIKTQCKHGHPYDEVNTGWTRGGKRRYCKACKAVQEARRYRKKKAERAGA